MSSHVGSRTKLTFAIPKSLCYLRTLLTLGASHYIAKHLPLWPEVYQGKYSAPCGDLKIATLLRENRDLGECIRHSFDEVLSKPDGLY